MSSGRGGARVRSGPPPDPHSRNSLRKGVKSLVLSADGFAGEIPRFPLPQFRVVDAEGIRDANGEKRFASREKTVWRHLWSLPQAEAWSMPEYSYMFFEIALYARQLVICEQAGATAADRGLLPRFADRIGLSEAAMAGFGWSIRSDTVVDSARDLSVVDGVRVLPRRMRGGDDA